MLEKDNAFAAIAAKVSEVKASTTLDASNQQSEYSGHSSANYGSGPDKSAAVPGGSPGTSY